jgi:hypothetical protein
MSRTRHRCRPSGLFIADAVAGLAVITVLALAIIVATRGYRIASDRLADTRGATWAAEQALAELQAGRSSSGAKDDVRIEPVNADAVPEGYAWVRVRALRNGRSAELIGLVPKSAAGPTGGQR